MSTTAPDFTRDYRLAREFVRRNGVLMSIEIVVANTGTDRDGKLRLILAICEHALGIEREPSA